MDGPCTEADKLADRLIVDRLKSMFPSPDFGYLTEESEDNKERLGCKRVWIIDPIDGTKEFIKKNGNFVIHIALAEQMEDGPGNWSPRRSIGPSPATCIRRCWARAPGANRSRPGGAEQRTGKQTRLMNRGRVCNCKSAGGIN